MDFIMEDKEVIATSETIIDQKMYDSYINLNPIIPTKIIVTLFILGVMLVSADIVLNSYVFGVLGATPVVLGLLMVFVKHNSKKTNNETAKKALDILTNQKSIFTFYNGFFHCKTVGDKYRSEIIIEYNNIDKVLEDCDYYFITYLNVLYAVQKDNLEGDVEKVALLLVKKTD